MIDVFLTTNATHPFRIGAAFATIAAWCEEVVRGRCKLWVCDIGSDPLLHEVLERKGLLDYFGWRVGPAEGSHRDRHLWARDTTASDPYIVTDDDLPMVPGLRVRDHGSEHLSWAEYMPRVFEARPKLAVLSALPSPGAMDPWVTRAFLQDIAPHMTEELRQALYERLQLPGFDDEVWTVGNVGGLRFMRRGAVTDEIPPMDREAGGGYDSTLCHWLRQQGWQVGYSKRIAATHIGFARSTTWGGEHQLRPLRP